MEFILKLFSADSLYNLNWYRVNCPNVGHFLHFRLLWHIAMYNQNIISSQYLFKNPSMCPNQIKRENSDNPFIREIIDTLVLLLQVVLENRQLPNVGHWKIYDKRPKITLIHEE